jgi:Immunity protein Imm1
MRVRYLNQQDDSDPMNGEVIGESDKLAKILDSKRNEVPFVAELRGDNGFMLVFGIGLGLGCVEHRHTNGDVPYLVAVSPRQPIKNGDIEFLCGGTPTPIPARNILRSDELRKIALYFLETGERSDAFAWEPI